MTIPPTSVTFILCVYIYMHTTPIVGEIRNDASGTMREIYIYSIYLESYIYIYDIYIVYIYIERERGKRGRESQRERESEREREKEKEKQIDTPKDPRNTKNIYKPYKP